MSPLKTLKVSLTALRRNMTRSALTISGIVIGIAAVICIMEIGQGSSASISKSIASMGANNLLILPGQAASGGISFGAGSNLTLTAEDCEAILKDVPGLADAAPIVRMSGQVVYQDRNWIPNQMQGTTPAYLSVRQWPIAEGEPFTEYDVRNANRVCIIGSTLMREIFDGRSPIGAEIRIKNVGFRVVGVLSPKGANSFGQDQDDVVFVPWTTAKFRVGSNQQTQAVAQANANASNTAGTASTATGGVTYPGTGAASLYPTASGDAYRQMAVKPRFINIDQILAAAKTPADIKPAIADIETILRERHHIREDEPNDFQIRDMTEGASILTSTIGTITTLLLVVAAISLAVGGVGIMNIMLVSVTERTREIGLRLAVGARGRDVLRQFLTEAVVLCTIGGAVGFGIGRAASELVRYVTGWTIQASLSAAVVAFCVSAAIGTVFGFYPAWKAARLDPIEALRYE